MNASRPLTRRHAMLGGALAGAAAVNAGTAGAEPETRATPGPDDHRKVELKDTAHTRAYYTLARDR